QPAGEHARSLERERGWTDYEFGALDAGHDVPLSVWQRAQRVDTNKRPGRVHPFPGAVEPWIRYGRVTLVPSPVAEMLKVPAALLSGYEEDSPHLRGSCAEAMNGPAV